MLLGHEMGVARGMAREVLTAGGDGGFAKRTFSVGTECKSREETREGPIGLVKQ